jgi:hypothetical protein
MGYYLGWSALVLTGVLVLLRLGIQAIVTPPRLRRQRLPWLLLYLALAVAWTAYAITQIVQAPSDAESYEISPFLAILLGAVLLIAVAQLVNLLMLIGKARRQQRTTPPATPTA